MGPALAPGSLCTLGSPCTVALTGEGLTSDGVAVSTDATCVERVPASASSGTGECAQLPPHPFQKSAIHTDCGFMRTA